MSVLVKGVEMPKSCHKCFIKQGSCPAIRKRIQVLPTNSDIWVPYNYRYDDCPLGNVPTPHGRLGDLDALAAQCDDPHWCVWLNEIEDAPTIIEAEE